MAKRSCGDGLGVSDELRENLVVLRMQAVYVWQLTGVKTPLRLAVDRLSPTFVWSPESPPQVPLPECTLMCRSRAAPAQMLLLNRRVLDSKHDVC